MWNDSLTILLHTYPSTHVLSRTSFFSHSILYISIFLYHHFYAQHSIPYLFAFFLHLVKIICFLLWMLIESLFKEVWSLRSKKILDSVQHEPYLPPCWYWVMWIIFVSVPTIALRGLFNTFPWHSTMWFNFHVIYLRLVISY